MNDKVILLVEDNADDEALTLRALKKNNIKNEVVEAHDGDEALDYLSGTGAFAARSRRAVAQLVLLDMQLPRGGRLGALRRLRAGPRTHPLPVPSRLRRRAAGAVLGYPRRHPAARRGRALRQDRAHQPVAPLPARPRADREDAARGLRPGKCRQVPRVHPPRLSGARD